MSDPSDSKKKDDKGKGKAPGSGGTAPKSEILDQKHILKMLKGMQVTEEV
jgi:hypothetical protein